MNFFVSAEYLFDDLHVEDTFLSKARILVLSTCINGVLCVSELFIQNRKNESRITFWPIRDNRDEGGLIVFMCRTATGTSYEMRYLLYQTYEEDVPGVFVVNQMRHRYSGQEACLQAGAKPVFGSI